MNIYTMLINNFLITTCDSAERLQTGIQDPATPMLEGFFSFLVTVYLMSIDIVMICMLYVILTAIKEENFNSLLEIPFERLLELLQPMVATIFLFTLPVLYMPFSYYFDELVASEVISKKFIEWYWGHQHSELYRGNYADANQKVTQEELTFDSCILKDELLTFGALRSIELDKKTLLTTHIRLLMTSADVLHSWAVPSLGIQLDFAPGILRPTPSLFIKREEVFYGQCSEICGINHGFMPIAVVYIPKEEYILWLTSRNKTN
jgi:cytochrome c oxidase subunit 2